MSENRASRPFAGLFVPTFASAVLLFAGSLPAEEPVNAGAPPDARATLAAKIDAYVRPLDERGDLSGNLLVAIGDEVVYERSFGRADVELDVRVTPETAINIASVTKSMTLVALARLIDAGKLDLADPLAKWIPEFPRGDAITIEMLATHRSGIPHRLTEPADETVPRTASDMAALAARKPLEFEPGERRSYSSGGYAVLARVLEKASGRTYADLLRERVFSPAGMTRSTHADSRQIVPGRAPSYYVDGHGGLINSPPKDLSFLVGAGSVFSTARDLHRFLVAARTGAYGERARSYVAGESGIFSNGYTAGYRAFADWHADTDLSVVWISNLHTGAGDALKRDVPRIAAGEDVPPLDLPAARAIPVEPDVLRGFEGAYELRPGTILHVRSRDGLLFANDWTLVPIGGRSFFSPQDYAVVEVVVDDSGRPVRLDWSIAGGTLPCPRVGDAE